MLINFLFIFLNAKLLQYISISLKMMMMMMVAQLIGYIIKEVYNPAVIFL